jgi:light-harvesting protein B-800-850 beta chain
LKEINMTDERVYPTGLTEAQALEINEGLKWGTRIYGGIAVLAHILAYMLTPWLQ